MSCRCARKSRNRDSCGDHQEDARGTRCAHQRCLSRPLKIKLHPRLRRGYVWIGILQWLKLGHGSQAPSRRQMISRERQQISQFLTCAALPVSPEGNHASYQLSEKRTVKNSLPIIWQQGELRMRPVAAAVQVAVPVFPEELRRTPRAVHVRLRPMVWKRRRSTSSQRTPPSRGPQPARARQDIAGLSAASATVLGAFELLQRFRR